MDLMEFCIYLYIFHSISAIKGSLGITKSIQTCPLRALNI